MHDSDIDLKEAYQLGAAAVSHLLLGRSGGWSLCTAFPIRLINVKSDGRI